MELAESRRGEYKDMTFLTEERVSLKYALPLAEVITDLFKESSVFQSKRFNDGDEADNDSLSLKEFLAVFCGGSNLGEAMYCMDLDARHKKKGKTADGDLKGTLKGSSVTLELPGSDRASARQLTRVATLSNAGKV